MFNLVVGTNRTGSISKKLSFFIEKIYQEENEKLNVIQLDTLPQELLSPKAFQEKPKSFLPISENFIKK